MQAVDLKKRIWQAFQRLPPDLQKLPILLAVSGGKDSSVLASAVLELRDRLPALHFAHVNYHLRKPDSDHEEKFLREWARSQKIPFHVKKFFPKRKPPNLQAWAREKRLNFFFEVQKKLKSSLSTVWLAHHRQDQAETVLERILRGSGLRGIGGMGELEIISRLNETSLDPPLYLFRPLLEVPPEAIAIYARFHRLRFHHDRSNSTDVYLRNRVRRKILPLMARENPRIQEALCQLAKGAREAHQSLRFLAREWLKKNLGRGRKGSQIPRGKIKDLPLGLRGAVFEEIVNGWGGPAQAFGQILPRLQSYLESPSLQIQLPLKGGHSIELDRDYLIFK